MAVFSKKGYEAMASALRRAKPPLEGFDSPQEAKAADDQWKTTIERVCDAFESDNSAFQKEKFIDWINDGR